MHSYWNLSQKNYNKNESIQFINHNFEILFNYLQKILRKIIKMGGACQSNTAIQELPTVQAQQNLQVTQPKSSPRASSNPFIQLGRSQNNELSNYQFRSRYYDEFIGDCSLIQEINTGDLYLWKEITTYNDQDREQLENMKNHLTSENVIRIKDVIFKDTTGIFGTKKRLYIIIDYPLISFQKQIATRIEKKISFTKQEIYNFLNSTIRGYAAIQRSGFKTDKVRLRNIFIGIKNKNAIIKVAQNNLLQPKSNFYYIMHEGGPNNIKNRDIYLSPEQYRAWVNDNGIYAQQNKFYKQGVFSLGMCFLDVCIMDPSRQIYHFTQKSIDFPQIRHRIQIVGKKYDANIQKLLREMLQQDPSKRISFIQLEQMLPTLTKNENISSRMHLSVIPNRKSAFIHNSQPDIKSNQMWKSVVSNVNTSNLKSRVFTSRIKMDQSRMKQEEVQKIQQRYTNGNKYIGQKKGPYKHGTGKYYHKDGYYYDGEWYQNKINGRGILYFKDGKVQYDGQWRNDLYNGWGTLYSQASNWSRYEGEFRNGVKEGRGRMYFRDGSIYDGEFRADKISGRGRKVTPNGQVSQKYWDTISPEAFF